MGYETNNIHEIKEQSEEASSGEDDQVIERGRRTIPKRSNILKQSIDFDTQI